MVVRHSNNRAGRIWRSLSAALAAAAVGLLVLPPPAWAPAGAGKGRRLVGIAEIDPLSAVAGSSEARSFPSMEAEPGKIEIRDVLNGIVLGSARTRRDGSYRVRLDAPLVSGQIIQAFNITRGYCSSGAEVGAAAPPRIDGPLKAGAKVVKGRGTPGHMIELVNAVTGATIGSPVVVATSGEGSFEITVDPLPLFHAVRAEDTVTGLSSDSVPVLGLSRANLLPRETCVAKLGTQAVSGTSTILDCRLQHPRGLAVGPDGAAYVVAGSPPSDLVAATPLGVFRLDLATKELSLFAAVHGVQLELRLSDALFESGIYVARPRVHFVRKAVALERGDGEILRVDATTGQVEVFARLLDLAPTGLAFDAPSGSFGGHMLVSGYFGDEIARISPSGGVSVLAVNLPGVAGLAVDEAGVFGGGDLFAAQPSSGSILRIDSAGYATQFASGLISPTGVAFGPGGAFGTDLYVADAGAGAIAKVSASGSVAPFATGLGAPVDLAFSPDGVTLFVTDYAKGRLIRFDLASL